MYCTNMLSSIEVQTDYIANYNQKCDLGEVEDEKHVIMTCPNYENDRKKLLDLAT